MSDELVARLKEALIGNENVLLAYLFGSRARGEGSTISDYDLAVLLKEDDLRSLSEVLFAASKALGVSEDLVDILDLRRAPLSLRARCLKEGVKLLDRGYERGLVEEANRAYPELSLVEAKALRWWLDNPEGIDVRVVKERLDYMHELAKYITGLLERLKPDDLARQVEAYHALKSMVEDASQAIIDICAHVSNAKSLGAVSAYREYVEKLVGAGLMARDLGEDVKLAIALRNRLIHRYLYVSPQELWQGASRLASAIIPSFKGWVLALVKGEQSHGAKGLNKNLNI